MATNTRITPAFTKLQRSIVLSSIWLEDLETRVVWVTLLALCDRDGITRCSPNGLAHQARVSPEGCAKAIQILSSPDPDSRDDSNEGRRIERCSAGFRVLNYLRVMSEGITEEERDYNRERQRERRAKLKANGGTIRPEHLAKRRREAREKARESGDASGVHVHGPGETES
jgi:hypothetical protein